MRRFAVLPLLLVSSLAAAAEPVDIGSRRELFVDHFLIEKLDGTELRLHRPVDEGRVLAFDKPWEGPFCAYVTVIKAGDKYQMYYRGFHAAPPRGTRTRTRSRLTPSRTTGSRGRSRR